MTKYRLAAIQAWNATLEDLRQDSERVGVAQTALPALNGNDGLVGPDDAHVQSVLQSIPDSVVDVDLPLGGGDTSGLGVVDGVDTSVQVALSSGEFISGDYNAAMSGSAMAAICAGRYSDSPQMIGHWGRYLDSSRAVVPLNTLYQRCKP